MFEARFNDGKLKIKYNAFQFERLAPSDLRYRRQHLQCLECDGDAYFRKRSKNGNDPCFGARHLEALCGGLSPDEREAKIQSIEKTKKSVSRVMRSKQELELVFRSPLETRKKPKNTSEIVQEAAASGKGKIIVRKSHDKNPVEEKSPVLNLKKLLSWVIDDDEMVKRDRSFIVNGKTRYFNEIFREFRDAQSDGEYFLYWGVIQYADIKKKWLNTGRDQLSIVIDDAFLDDFHAAFKIKSREKLIGRYAMVYGKCRKSSKTGKNYITVYNVAYIHLGRKS
jgi:hypothetical protein